MFAYEACFLDGINFTATQRGKEERELVFSYSKGFCNVLINFSKQKKYFNSV